MEKRIFSFLVCAILACSLFSAQAEGLTKEAIYSSALQELQKYLNDEPAMDIASIQSNFAKLGSYELSVSFGIYAGILADVENDQFSHTAIALRQVKRNAEFDDYLSANGYGSLNELENYVAGREAEHNGDVRLAISFYESSISFMDSMERILLLEELALDAQYQEAVALYNNGTAADYQTAYELFSELAGIKYKDSQQMAEKILPLLASVSTPTAAPLPVTATPAPISAAPVLTPAAPQWPEIVFQDHSVKLTGKTERIAARLGPDKTAASIGGYKVNKAAKYTALFREGNYIYCSAVNYSGVDPRCIYFPAGNVSGAKNVAETVFNKVDATMNCVASPRLGPGTEYELYNKVILENGSPVSVCGQYAGWLFIEYQYSFIDNKILYEGTGRGWIECTMADP